LNFVSYSFVVLFLIVVACRLTIGRRKVERPYLAILLASSLIFYAWHVPWHLLILLFSAGVDYAAALALGKRPAVDAAAVRWRRWLLFVSMATNLGLLAVFKYAAFALSVVAGDGAAIAGLPAFNLLLPMGISFYTFQSMSYTIDVYRGRLAALQNFPAFLLYISFFPQLVAGPIVRAVEFLPQLPKVRRPHLRVLNEGVFLLAGGYFLKMVCADNLAVFVNNHWNLGYEPGADSVLLIWLTLMFSAQILCDFAGYSQIARGLALILGFRLPLNFNAPYIAGSFQNFWERWHITLSAWLRDYLYIPLGGSRGSRARTYFNLMTVMILGGLWHGAAFTFIAWGALHGTALALERMLGLQQRGRQRSLAVRVLWWGAVQVVVLIAWVFFRSDDIDGAWQFLSNIAAFQSGASSDVVRLGSWFLLPPLAMHLWRLGEEHQVVFKLSPYHQAALTGLLVFLTATCYGPTNAFIYFQF